MWGLIDQLFQVGFLAALVRIATPLTLATLGETLSERAGVLNLGIEGIMLMGAMAGFSVAYFSGSLWLGVAGAVATGMALAALLALLTVSFGLSQHVSGIGVTLLSTGLAFFIYRLVFGQPSQPPSVPPFQTLPIPGLADLPVIGPSVFNQYALVYLAMALVPIMAFVLGQTPWGLSVRMVGENPDAADSAGISVAARRWQAVVIGGGLMGAAGAFLSLAQFNAFTFGVVNGRGWVAIALVVFGTVAAVAVPGRRAAVRLHRRIATAAPGEQLRPACPLRDFLDPAVRHDHRRDGARFAQRRLRRRRSEALPQGGTLMLELILRRANLPDGRVGVDIGVADGQIVAIEPSLAAAGAREIDATGRFATPPFVDSHFHLDSALSVGRPRYNESGTLLEGIRDLGRAEAADHRRRHLRPRARPLPLGGRQGHARHPLPCRCLRRPAARGRRAPRRAPDDEALSRSPACRLSAGRLLSLARPRGPISAKR